MRTTASGRKNGIFSLFWTVLVQINYLDFADDLALLSHHQRQMKEKNSINRSGIQYQSKQQKTEDQHHLPNTSRKCWWAHQSWTLHLPGKYGWHAKWPRPWHQAKNWQGKCCIYHAGPQGSHKLQILNSNRKSLYCYMEQREGEQPNKEDASYYTLYYIL